MSNVSLTLSTGNELANIIDGLKDIQPRFAREISRTVLPELERVLDRRLRVVPPPRHAGSPKFVWSKNPKANERARRWFFRNYPDGYTRTGALARAWIADTVLKGGTITISVSNNSKGASYVYGSEQYDQVPGHIQTGWLNAPDTVLDVFAEIENEIIAAVDAVLEAL